MAALAMGTALSAQTCDPVDLPYSENFDAVTTPAIPQCMSLETIRGNPWKTVLAPGGMTGNSANVTYTPTGSPDQDTWLFTPGLNLTGGTSYRLTYKYFTNGTFFMENFAVSYGTGTSSGTMVQQLANHPSFMSATVLIDTVEFTPGADGVYYIGFQCSSIADQNQLYLDDILIQATPSCEEPTLLMSSNLSDSGADFSWSASVSAPSDGYEWELRTSGAGGSGNTGLADAGTTPAGTVNGSSSILQANTTYYLYVRSNCGQGDFSLWATPATFTTACVPTDVPYMENFNALTTPELPNCMSTDLISGNPWTSINAPQGMTGIAASVTYTAGGSPDQDTWLFTQGLNLTAGTSYRLTYKYFNSSTAYQENLAVSYGSSSDGSAMTLPLADHPNISTTTVQLDTVEFTPATDGVFYIGFQCYSIANQLRLYVDDIRVTETPTCEEPTLLSVSNITSTSADLSWTASVTNPANGYQWEIRTSGDGGSGAAGLVDSGTTAAGGTTASSTMLDPDGTYYLYVRSDCGTADQSLWAGPQTFTTLCIATDVPYLENFDGVTTPDIPNCMSNQTISGNPWKTSGAPLGMTGNAASVGYTQSGSPEMNTWLFTQGLNLVAGTTYRLTYDYFNSNTNYTESMAVAYGTTAEGAAMTAPLANHPSISTNTVQDGQSDFTVGATGVYYIGFKCFSIANQLSLYLDNVEVVALVHCTELPDPGLTTGPDNICPGVEFTVGIENPSNDGGISYQWEISSDGTTWNTAGGADSLDTYTTMLTGDTWFRLQVTCDSAGTATSTPLEVTANDPGDCYCESAFTSVSLEYITNVNFAGIDNTSDGTIGGPVDYTAQVAQVTQGGTETLSVTIMAASVDYVYAFIDWNHNGILDDAGEVYTLAANTSDNGPHTLAITVPVDAYVGATRMRVLMNYNGSTPDPCMDDTWGEAEDYTVQIAAGVLVDDCEGELGGPATPGTVCIGDNGFGGVWSADCLCVENVGIEEIVAKEGVAVYPNPASTELFISTANDMPVHVKVYDMVGHLVMERNMATRLDISALAPGSYSLVILDSKGNNQAHARFVKQ